MASLLLSLGVFVYLAMVGRATFALLGVRLGRTRTWLIAPALGLCLVSLVVMVLNQAGWPIAVFARAVAGVTLAGSLAVLWRNRLSPPRELRPFALVLAAALALGGWPALLYGWNWIGYGNDDMTNYCLGAERFLRQGFYAVPTLDDLDGGNYPALYWMLHVAGQIRFGSEQAVAWLAGITGLKVIEVFMPSLLALALTQISAVMGLAWHWPRGRQVALATGYILALSPLWHAGLMYQLIAQVAGLALLAALAVLVFRRRFPPTWRSRLRLGAVCSLLISGLSIYYPEVLPFLVLGWCVFVCAQVMRARRWPAGMVTTAGCALALTFILLRQNTLSTTFTLLGQARDGIDAQSTLERVSLFPYFLMPGGPAFLCGFDVFVNRYPEPWTSVGLVGGFLGLATLLLFWLRGLRDGAASAAILAAMIPVGALLFTSRNGFGLFKLCMFALPFLVIVLAHHLESRPRRRWIWLGYGILAAAWLPGIWRYSLPATCLDPNQSSELLHASLSRGTLPATAAPAWAATASSPVNKLLMLEAPANRPAFLSQFVGIHLLGRASQPFPDWVWRCLPGQADGATASHLAHKMETEVFHQQHAHGLTFWTPRRGDLQPQHDTVLISSQAEWRAFNKAGRQHGAGPSGLFTTVPVAGLANHLVFVQSTEGYHYYLGDPGRIAVYRPQPDIYLPDEYFFAIGRHLLFRVINPGESYRLRFAMTASILGAGRTELPAQAVVRHGRSQVTPLGLVGSGSASVISEPLRPVTIDGVDYIAIDLGRPPMPLGLPAVGLQGLFRRQLSLDTRLALGYCRDISLVSEADYAARTLPRAISSFPADLLSRRLNEYSGIYEDGWMAQQAFVKLGPVKTGDRLVVTGLFARTGGADAGNLKLTLLLNDQPVQVYELAYGTFELQVEPGQTKPELKVGLLADRVTTLPVPDQRPVSILLQSIRLQSSP